MAVQSDTSNAGPLPTSTWVRCAVADGEGVAGGGGEGDAAVADGAGLEADEAAIAVGGHVAEAGALGGRRVPDHCGAGASALDQQRRALRIEQPDGTAGVVDPIHLADDAHRLRPFAARLARHLVD